MSHGIDVVPPREMEGLRGQWGQERVKRSVLATSSSQCQLDHSVEVPDQHLAARVLGNLHSGAISIHMDLVEVIQGGCIGSSNTQNNPGAHQHFKDLHQYM